MSDIEREAFEQASRQELEGDPVGTARRCGYDRDITYCDFEADEVPIGTKLYTHPASAEVERLQARVAELHGALVLLREPWDLSQILGAETRRRVENADRVLRTGADKAGGDL
jgi:hypothetical protein